MATTRYALQAAGLQGRSPKNLCVKIISKAPYLATRNPKNATRTAVPPSVLKIRGWVWIRFLWGKWKDALIVVKPETVVKWHRMGFRIYWKYISNRYKNRGRNKIDRETRHLIRKMSKENPTWRAPRIPGELLKLGFDVSERTFSRYLPKKEPDGEKVKKWMALLLIACKNGEKKINFFAVTTLFSRLSGILGWGCHPLFKQS